MTRVIFQKAYYWSWFFFLKLLSISFRINTKYLKMRYGPFIMLPVFNFTVFHFAFYILSWSIIFLLSFALYSSFYSCFALPLRLKLHHVYEGLSLEPCSPVSNHWRHLLSIVGINLTTSCLEFLLKPCLKVYFSTQILLSQVDGHLLEVQMNAFCFSLFLWYQS